MPFYKVNYSSMTASYGPAYIEAGSPEQAKSRAGRSFTAGERAFCMTATEVSSKEIERALRNKASIEHER